MKQEKTDEKGIYTTPTLWTGSETAVGALEEREMSMVSACLDTMKGSHLASCCLLTENNAIVFMVFISMSH